MFVCVLIRLPCNERVTGLTICAPSYLHDDDDDDDESDDGDDGDVLFNIMLLFVFVS